MSLELDGFSATWFGSVRAAPGGPAHRRFAEGPCAAPPDGERDRATE
jgi:hypothetical protein